MYWGCSFILSINISILALAILPISCSISICGVTGFSERFSAYRPTLVAYINLEVSAADIGNLHVNMNCMGRIWTICKLDFGAFELKGKLLAIVLALYGLDPVVLVGFVKLMWQRV